MKEKIAVTLDALLVKRLDRMAGKLETSRSALLERFLLDGLDDQERVVEFLVSKAGREGWLQLFSRMPGADRMFLASIGPAISGEERRATEAFVRAEIAGKVDHADS